MEDNLLFEYAVIRVVPRVEREEFINVGVVLFCSKKKYLKSLYVLDEERLKGLFKDIEIKEIEENLRSFTRICAGGKEAGPLGELDLASRFRWLTATRSTVVQTSKVHPGLSAKPEDKLERLLEELVL